MQTSLQIAFRNLDRSEAAEELIREKAARLERFYGRITGCRVVVEAPHRHRREGSSYRVRMELAVPRGVIAVTRDPPGRAGNPDLGAAIGDAFDAARRQLEDFARRQRGVKAGVPPGLVGHLRPRPARGVQWSCGEPAIKPAKRPPERASARVEAPGRSREEVLPWCCWRGWNT